MNGAMYETPPARRRFTFYFPGERFMKEPASHAKRPSVGPSASRSASPPSGPPSSANNSPRPPFFSEVVRAEICSVIAAGCMFRVAARYVGCTVRAIAELKRCDREFARQLDRALVQRELIPLSHIREASKNSWKAAAWLLAHTVGGRYGEHVMTFEEELDAEESEQFSTAMADVQRPSSEPDAEFGPYEPLANSQGKDPRAGADAEPTKVEPAKTEPTKVTSHDSTTSAEETAATFEIPGFGKLVPAQSAASNPNDPTATVKRVPPATTTPATATTRPTPLPPAAFTSDSVGPGQILDSMRALDDLWKA